MKILKKFIIITLITAVSLVALFFISREVMLWYAIKIIKDSVQNIRRLANRGEYRTKCYKMGVSRSYKEIFYTQIRFVNDQEYFIEAVCYDLPTEPIYIDRSKLPFFVKRKAGSSGIIWGQKTSGMDIELYGAAKRIWIDKNQVYSSNDVSKKTFFTDLINLIPINLEKSTVGEQLESFETIPLADCNAYGYHCCDAVTQQGVGQEQKDNFDCAGACYEKCQNVPIVLSFHSVPTFEAAKREVTINRGENINFTYIIDHEIKDTFNTEEFSFIKMLDETLSSLFRKKELPSTLPLLGVIEYGDGNSDSFSTLQGKTSHAYTCNTDICSYDASISAQKGELSSKTSSISHIKVIVK